MNNKNALSNSTTATMNINELPNAVLQRLIKEVAHDKKNNVLAYDRVHNRHNR